MSKLTDFLPGAMPKASEQDAREGTRDDVVMTPLGTEQYVAEQKGTAYGLATLDASEKVPEEQIPASVGIGAGQTWQAVDRTKDMSYQNSTGKAIVLNYSRSGYGTSARIISIEVSPNNADWMEVAVGGGTGNSAWGTATAIIPAGWFYRYSENETFGGSRRFRELR